jgi:hypothetical protein
MMQQCTENRFRQILTRIDSGLFSKNEQGTRFSIGIKCKLLENKMPYGIDRRSAPSAATAVVISRLAGAYSSYDVPIERFCVRVQQR